MAGATLAPRLMAGDDSENDAFMDAINAAVDSLDTYVARINASAVISAGDNTTFKIQGVNGPAVSGATRTVRMLGKIDSEHAAFLTALNLIANTFAAYRTRINANQAIVGGDTTTVKVQSLSGPVVSGATIFYRSISRTDYDLNDVETQLNGMVDALAQLVTSWNLKQGGTPTTLIVCSVRRIRPFSVSNSGPGVSLTRAITVSSGNSQTTTVATQPTNPLVARVVDGNGNLVVNESVSWAVTSGDGTVTAASLTNSSGLASATPLAGSTAGDITVTATASDGNSVAFTLTGTAGTATAISARTVVDQSALTSGTVATPPSCFVSDTYGNAKSGTVVTYAVTGGGGSGTTLTPTSGSDGIATVGSWTMGAVAGANTMTATAAGLTGSPVTFRASGTSPNVPTILTINSGQTQSAITAGSASALLECKVTNDALTAQQGVVVFYTVLTGSGTLSAATATTNASGLTTAPTYTTHTTVGTATVQARAFNSSGVELTNSPVTFTLTSVAGAATKLVINTQPQPSGALDGVAFTQQPIIHITDANGNRKTSDTSTVTAAKQTGSGTLGGTLTAVAVAGVATFTNLKITGTGDHTLVFTDGGLTQVISGTVSIAPPIPVALQFQGPVTGNAAGTVWASFAVQVVDNVNVVVPGSTATVTLSISGAGSLGGTISVQAVAGVATFSTVTGTPAGTYTLTAASSGLTSATTSVTITSSVPSTHPNEPASMTTIINDDCVTAQNVPNTGWGTMNNGTRVRRILVSAVPAGDGIATCPFTLQSGFVMQGDCPLNQNGGSGPFLAQRAHTGYTEIYTDEIFQLSPLFDAGNWGSTAGDVSKAFLWPCISQKAVQYMKISGTGFGAVSMSFVMQAGMRGPDAALTTSMRTDGTALFTVSTGVQRNKWYRLIRRLVLNTGAATFDGIAQIWFGDETTDFTSAGALKVNALQMGYAGNNTNSGSAFGAKWDRMIWNPTANSGSVGLGNPSAFSHWSANFYVSGK